MLWVESYPLSFTGTYVGFVRYFKCHSCVFFIKSQIEYFHNLPNLVRLCGVKILLIKFSVPLLSLVLALFEAARHYCYSVLLGRNCILNLKLSTSISVHMNMLIEDNGRGY